MKYDSYQASGIEWLGNIPSHWKILRIGQAFKERKGKVSDKDFAPLSVTKNGIVPQLENAAKSNAGDDRKKVLKGDFVINSRSDRKGSSGISSLDGSVSLISIVLEPKELYCKYVHNLLRSYDFTEEFYKNGQGIVADLWSTKYSLMKSIYIPIPPNEEQKAIADFLDKKLESINNYISKQKELIELLKEKKSSLINQAITKGIDNNVEYIDSGIEWLGKIPKHWKIKKLKYVSKLNPLTKAIGIDRKEKIEFLPMENVDEKSGEIKKFNFRELHEIKKGYTPFKNNDIIFAKITPCMENGNCVIVENTKYNIAYGSTEFIVFRTKKVIINKYLFFILRNKLFRNVFELNMRGSAGQKRISTDFLLNFEITFPKDIVEQEKIVNYIEKESKKIDDVISNIEDELKLLDEYKQSIISSAVTGKIKVF